jgi:hypothetical protein
MSSPAVAWYQSQCCKFLGFQNIWVQSLLAKALPDCSLLTSAIPHTLLAHELHSPTATSRLYCSAACLLAKAQDCLSQGQTAQKTPLTTIRGMAAWVHSCSIAITVFAGVIILAFSRHATLLGRSSISISYTIIWSIKLGFADSGVKELVAVFLASIFMPPIGSTCSSDTAHGDWWVGILFHAVLIWLMCWQ